MASKSNKSDLSMRVMRICMLVLRIVSLAMLVVSAVLLLTNTSKLSDGQKITFMDVSTYRYVIAVTAVGALYLILQLPMAAFYAATGTRLIGGALLPEFDFFADKATSLILASGVGAGFAVTYELKSLLPDAFLSLAAFAQAAGQADTAAAAAEEAAKIPSFFDRAYVACGALLVACVCMVVVSVLSSINRTKS